jgi:hypothetical protein
MKDYSIYVKLLYFWESKEGGGKERKGKERRSEKESIHVGNSNNIVMDLLSF